MSKWLALHGLFGDFSQWDFLNQLNNVDLQALDLYPLMDLSKDELLMDLLSRFVANNQHSNNLIGYSMGGRIAMELFLKSPDSFNKLILLASHPGLEDNTAILARKNWENSWISKIQQLPQDFITDWNKQSIFEHDQDILLPDKPLQQLIAGIATWGLSKQKNLLPDLLKHRDKVLWLIGSKDSNYLKLAEDRLGDFSILKVENAGHRLLQHPEEVLKCLKTLKL